MFTLLLKAIAHLTPDLCIRAAWSERILHFSLPWPLLYHSLHGRNKFSVLLHTHQLEVYGKHSWESLGLPSKEQKDNGFWFNVHLLRLPFNDIRKDSGIHLANFVSFSYRKNRYLKENQPTKAPVICPHSYSKMMFLTVSHSYLLDEYGHGLVFSAIALLSEELLMV